MTDQPYYLTKPFTFSMAEDTANELGQTLVHRLMIKNGWDFPAPGDDPGDYAMAIDEVTWYITQIVDLARESLRRSA